MNTVRLVCTAVRSLVWVAALVAIITVSGSVAMAQPRVNTRAAARGMAVEKIMAQIEQVQLAPLMTGRDLFERVPELRLAAKRLVVRVAAEAPVAAMPPAGHRVDVSLPGDRLLRHLEDVCTAIKLPRDLRRSLSFGGFARGRIYQARGEAGGVPLPRAWRAVAERDRDLAAGAARLQAMEMALAQIVSAARNQGLPGAARLATLLGDGTWVRHNATKLIGHGARELRGAQFLDDGTCRVVLELPSTALFRTLAGQGHIPGLPSGTRAALAKALRQIAGTGVGIAKAPEARNALDRPRVLRASFTAVPAPGATGAVAMSGAAVAAKVKCHEKLLLQLYQVRWDARRTVGDYVRERTRAGDATVRDRVSRFLGTARKVQSRAAPGDQWYVEMELNLDGLEAALRG